MVGRLDVSPCGSSRSKKYGIPGPGLARLVDEPFDKELVFRLNGDTGSGFDNPCSVTDDHTESTKNADDQNQPA